MIKLYAAVGSCSLCAHVALIEGGIEHEVTYVVLCSPSSPLPAVNPLSKVPTLVLPEGETITQSTVVLPFIADLNPDSRLLPAADARARRSALQWLGFFNSDVHPALKMLAGPERYSSDPEHLRAAYEMVLAGHFGIVEKALANRPWLTGDAMTIADIYGAAAFNWGREYGLDVRPYGSFRELSARFEARESTKRARAMESEFAEASQIKYEFMSAGWLAMAQDEVGTALATMLTSRDLRFSAIERFADVPDDAPRPPKGEPGFKLVIADGKVEACYGVEADETADLEIECRWNDSWRSVSLHHGSELEAFNAERIAGDRLHVKGSVGKAGPLLNKVHDRVANRTIPPH